MSTQPTNYRRVALWGGLSYLATFIFSMPAVGLLAPATDHVKDFMTGGGGDDTQVLVGGIFELVTALACVATALALYPAVRRVSKTSALGFMASRTVEAGLILVGVVSILSVVTLRQDLGGGGTGGLVAVAHGLVDVRDWTFLFGPGVMPAFNALFLGTVLYKSGLVPRILPLLGLVGAPLLVTKSMIVAFDGMGDMSVVAMLMALPIAAWELGLGLWLTFKGFRASPYLDEPKAA
jgi:hypothetical protein